MVVMCMQSSTTGHFGSLSLHYFPIMNYVHADGGILSQISRGPRPLAVNVMIGAGDNGLEFLAQS